MAKQLQTLVSLLARGPRRDESRVHFHQGPQGQPMPCFDEGCANPRLSI